MVAKARLSFFIRPSVTPFNMKIYAGRPDLIVSFVMTFTLGLAAGSAAVALLTRLMSRPRLTALMLAIVVASGVRLYYCAPSDCSDVCSSSHKRRGLYWLVTDRLCRLDGAITARYGKTSAC
jgi:hypothetical protein